MANKKFWTGLFAGAAVGYVAYRMFNGVKIPEAEVQALPDTQPDFSGYGITGQGRTPYPSSLHGIPTVPLPSVSAAHTRMARPTQAPPPPPPPPRSNGDQQTESFGGDAMNGMGGESF